MSILRPLVFLVSTALCTPALADMRIVLNTAYGAGYCDLFARAMRLAASKQTGQLSLFPEQDTDDDVDFFTELARAEQKRLNVSAAEFLNMCERTMDRYKRIEAAYDQLEAATKGD